MKPTFTWGWKWLGGQFFDIYVCGYLAERHCFKNKFNFDALSIQEEKVLERKALAFYEKNFGKVGSTKKR
jgi:hypothetical protein